VVKIFIFKLKSTFPMKNNLIIGALAILSVVSIVFGLVERAEAIRQHEIAIESEKRVQEQMQITVVSQREAELQYQRAKECCNKK
jgi:carbonic anhydrase/acetyltransferase-like protein (isoleucine patch superfamily)